ncbi:MAG: glycosyltransferase family 2 protein [Litoreibacter sp.]
MTPPNVSVVIPTYRDAVRIIDALRSVIAQDFEAWEALVIDDGSPEDIQSKVRSEIAGLQDPRIRLCISRTNRGAARARNIGIRLAKGRYIAFLDADDLWHPAKLSVQLHEMETSEAALSCTSYENVNEDTGERSTRMPPARLSYAETLRENAIGCSTVMLDREVLGRSYFPDIRMRQDFAHWLKILKSGHKAIGLPAVFTTRRIHKEGMSVNKFRAMRYTWSMLRQIEGLSLLKSTQITAHQIFGGVLRLLKR